MTDRGLEILNAVRKSCALPTMPAVAMEIVRLTRDPVVRIEDVATAIARDPALAAKTLRFANSSYYGAARPIVGLPQALVRIGMRGAKMVALSFGLVDSVAALGGDFDFPSFWYRSLVTSVTARRIALCSVRKLVDQAFLGALLSDIGCPILARTFPQEYRTVARLHPASPKRLDEMEVALLGVGHPEVGRMMLEGWQLPLELAEAVGAHHDLTPIRRDSPAFPVAAVIMAASELCDAIIRGASPQRADRLATIFRDLFSFGAEHMGVILTDLDPEIQQARELLEVPLPPPTLIQAQAKSQIVRLAVADADRRARVAAKPV